LDEEAEREEREELIGEAERQQAERDRTRQHDDDGADHGEDSANGSKPKPPQDRSDQESFFEGDSDEDRQDWFNKKMGDRRRHYSDGNGRRGDSRNEKTAQKNGDEGTKSIVKEASEAIMEKYRLLTIEESREIRYYRDGVYVPGGDILIEKVAEAMYGYGLANHHLSEIKGHIMRKTYHQRAEIDADTNIINLKNGLCNIQTGEFKEHSPDYLSISQVPVLYNPKARPQLFGQFLSQVLYPQEIRAAIELMAYTFYRDNPFEIITILFGYGANGKGVFTGLLTALHGAKNVSNVPLSAMLGDKFALSDLEGKSVNIDTELTSTTIRDTSVLKKITGRQPIRIQRKNERAYDTFIHAKLYFSANQVPSAYDESDAFFRRNVILTFPNRFEGDKGPNKEDPDLLKKLTTEEELSGIFNVLMPVLKRLLNRSRVYMKENTIEKRRERYTTTASPIEAFLEEAVAEDSVESDFVTKERLYQAYTRFCNKHNLAILSKESLGKILKSGKKFQEGRESSGKKRGTIWKGIKLTAEYDIDARQETLVVSSTGTTIADDVQDPTKIPTSTSTLSCPEPKPPQIPNPLDNPHEKGFTFNPVVSVENFFADEQSLPLSPHSLEQSPCSPIIGSKPAGNHTMYYCQVHPKTTNINLGSIEQHCKILDPDHHKSEIISRLHMGGSVCQ
jgi:P4 family phage/plasmid primase-like protien